MKKNEEKSKKGDGKGKRKKGKWKGRVKGKREGKNEKREGKMGPGEGGRGRKNEEETKEQTTKKWLRTLGWDLEDDLFRAPNHSIILLKPQKNLQGVSTPRSPPPLPQ